MDRRNALRPACGVHVFLCWKCVEFAVCGTENVGIVDFFTEKCLIFQRTGETGVEAESKWTKRQLGRAKQREEAEKKEQSIVKSNVP